MITIINGGGKVYTEQEIEELNKAPLVDSVGNFVKEGQIVAYNHSGNISVGRIKSVSYGWKQDRGNWFVRLGVTLKIEWLDGLEQNEGHISTVHNVNGVLVLVEPNGIAQRYQR